MRNLILLIVVMVLAGCATGNGPNVQALIDDVKNTTQAENRAYYSARFGPSCENAGYPQGSTAFKGCVNAFYWEDIEQRLDRALAQDRANSRLWVDRVDAFSNSFRYESEFNQTSYNDRYFPLQQMEVCDYVAGTRSCTRY